MFNTRYKPRRPAAFIGAKPRGLAARKRDFGLRRGYSLLLAVVITAAVITTATSVAGVVRAEIRQTREIEAAGRAYAQAESHIEEAIFLLRRAGLGLDEVRSRVSEDVEIEPDPRPQFFSIAENDFISLPLLPDSNRNRIEISQWLPGEDCSTSGESWIEISRFRWNADDGFSSAPEDRRVLSHSADGVSFNVTDDTVEVRIRALYCDISGLTVEGAPVRLRILSRARSGNVIQSVEAVLPHSAPVAGLFDFVLFSECELVKGLSGLASPPICPN